MPLVARLAGVERPSLGLAAVAAYLRRPSFVDGRSADSLQLAGREIPVNARRFMRINFLGPPSRAYTADSTFRVVSFVDVLRGRVDPAVWRGGLVFIGTLGATGLADDYWTPLSAQGRKMAGVEIHANAAATLFSTNFLRVAAPPAQAGLIVGLAVLLALLAASTTVVTAFVVALLVLVAFVAAEALALYTSGWLLPVAAPVLVGAIAFVAVLLPRLAAEQRQSRAARAALAIDRIQDRLTGLANRAYLSTAIQAAVLSEAPFALLVLDVDRFKDVNDALGHDLGDRLLQQVAERLRHALQEAATLIARTGGDEFAALVPRADSARAAEICAAVLAALEPAVTLNDRSLSVAASIGVAVYPQHGADPETLLRHADAAMYAAKQARRGSTLYSPDLEERTAERLELVTELRQAISGNELRLHYQPKVECRSGQVVGVEALVRWQHPRHGLMPPDRFIPIAEETGLIGPLTRWVLDAAIGQARAWLDSGFTKPMRIAVNLSPYDLQDPRLPAHVCGLLERHSVASDLLSLEITESALVADPNRALQVLSDLATRGVNAALDDFGTGYSSLTSRLTPPLCAAL
jgi:diguanylate cyclase (GGDEF)-like protein